MGELLSTCGPETNHLAFSHYKESMNFTTEATVIEVDDRCRDEILFIIMIVGPLLLLMLVAVLALVVYQKMDLNRMQRTEQRIAQRMRAVDRALWTHGQADEELDVMTDYYIADRSGDVMPPMVEFALEFLSSSCKPKLCTVTVQYIPDASRRWVKYCTYFFDW